MLTLIISVALSLGCFIASRMANGSMSESVGYAVAALIAAFFLIGFLVRKKITKVQGELQGIMMSGQKRLNQKIQQFQSRPGGNIKQIQRQIEADQMKVLQQALAFTGRLEPFKKWNFLMARQIVTMRFQFLYQLKEFEQVDQILAAGGLFKGPMMMEPMTVAMKMARQYKNGELAAVEKSFKRHIKWFRGNRGTLLYGLMSWIYMKQGESEKARQLLIKAKEKTGNETLARNLEMLSNNKDKQFSNSGLGEEWYGLYLENPPPVKQQRMRGDARGGRRF